MFYCFWHGPSKDTIVVNHTVRTHPSQAVVHILLNLILRLLDTKLFLQLGYLSRVISRVLPHVAEMVS